MARRFWACGMLLLALTAGAYADGKPAPAAPHAGLERMKKLAGTWVAADKDGKPTAQVV